MGESPEELLLAVGLLAPLLATGAMLTMPEPAQGRRMLRIGFVVAATAWGLLVAVDSRVAGAGFHAGPLMAAAACGAALLAVSADESPDIRSLVGGGLALTALTAGLAAGADDLSAPGLLAGLAVAAGCAVAASWDRGDREVVAPTWAAAIGVVAGAVALVLVHDATGTWALPFEGAASIPTSAVAALLVAAAALATAGGLRPGRSTCILAAAGLALGMVAVGLRDLGPATADPRHSGGTVAATAALAAAALVAAAAGRAALALILLSLAVAAGPPDLVAASRLLGAAGVLILAIDRRAAWLLGVPGGVALGVSATELGTGVAAGLGLATAAVAALLVWRATTSPEAAPWRRPALPAMPAVLVGAWLFVAPGSWSWVGPSTLGPYDAGAARAAAAGLIAVIALALVDTRTRRDAGVQRDEAPAEKDSGRLSPEPPPEPVELPVSRRARLRGLP
jgi:hypothetical protein